MTRFFPTNIPVTNQQLDDAPGICEDYLESILLHQTNMTSSLELTPNLQSPGLDLPDNLPYEDWAILGEHIAQTAERMPFLLGDWINEGEKRYGEKYSQAVSQLEGRYKPATLVNIASVARRIPRESRRPKLSFRHHAVCAYLEPQDRDRLLDAAEKHGLTSDELRKELREAKALPDPETVRESFHLTAEAKEALDYLESHLSKGRGEVVNQILVERADYSREGK